MSMQEGSSLEPLDSSFGLADLPSDVLVAVLRYLPLTDLANVRLLCTRIQEIVDDGRSSHLWARAPLDGLWIGVETRAVLERAAESGNVEALIKLAVAYIYSEGVPDGVGKGTVDAVNGVKATEYLSRVESLLHRSPPFSWVLFRPPWVPNNLCCKACICHHMKALCTERENVVGLHYCIGKALGFQETEDSVLEKGEEVAEWYKEGVRNLCPFSTFENWKLQYNSTSVLDSAGEIESMRMLRMAASLSEGSTFSEAQFALCECYAAGQYGGVSQERAWATIRQTMAAAGPVLWEDLFRLQTELSHKIRYILIDWMVEVAETKELAPPTLHLAVGLMERFMRHRQVPRSQLQLLGITALLVATRWMGQTIFTIREAAWVTNKTYRYEEVVRMLGEMVAVLRGRIRKPTICDYLQVMFKLLGAGESAAYTALYLSESILFHPDLGRFSAAHLAAACLLCAGILRRREFPWPAHMVSATGLSVGDLKKCCLMIYDRCLTENFSVIDQRQVKLQAVKERFSDPRFLSVGTEEVMPFREFMEQLGLKPESPCPFLTPRSHVYASAPHSRKLLSFLSDSCYLSPSSSPSCSISSSLASPPASLSTEDSCSSLDLEPNCLEPSLLVQFSTQRLSTSSASLSPTDPRDGLSLSSSPPSSLAENPDSACFLPAHLDLRPSTSRFRTLNSTLVAEHAPFPSLSNTESEEEEERVCGTDSSDEPTSTASHTLRSADASPGQERVAPREHDLCPPLQIEHAGLVLCTPAVDDGEHLRGLAEHDTGSLALDGFDFNLAPLNDLPPLDVEPSHLDSALDMEPSRLSARPSQDSSAALCSSSGPSGVGRVARVPSPSRGGRLAAGGLSNDENAATSAVLGHKAWNGEHAASLRSALRTLDNVEPSPHSLRTGKKHRHPAPPSDHTLKKRVN